MQLDTYTMINGKLAKWEVIAESPAQAISAVKNALGLPPKQSVLISVYLGPTQKELF